LDSKVAHRPPLICSFKPFFGDSSRNNINLISLFYLPFQFIYTPISLLRPNRNYYRRDNYKAPDSFIHLYKMDQTLDISKLSEADKKELTQFLQNESQKSAIQQSEALPLPPFFVSSPFRVGIALPLQVDSSANHVSHSSRRPPHRRHLLEEVYHLEDFVRPPG
jgi:hypothetical protein